MPEDGSIGTYIIAVGAQDSNAERAFRRINFNGKVAIVPSAPSTAGSAEPIKFVGLGLKIAIWPFQEDVRPVTIFIAYSVNRNRLLDVRWSECST
jgi:hypothetical protein